jgi:chromate transporter
MSPDRASRRRLVELARLFLRLGATSFGGPAAHIAMMEGEIVRRRGWLTHAEFLDLLSATNLIPGPNSTELAIHVGQRRAGWPGLITAGACFILPAALITLVLAWAYVRLGSLPALKNVLYGVKPVMIAVVLQALGSLGRTAIRSRLLAALALAATLAVLAGVNELVVLLAAGALVMIVRWRPSPVAKIPALAYAPAGVWGAVVVPSGPVAFGLVPLFLFFLKTGAVLFGSGYVLLAFLRADLVQRWHWLSEAQLLDAVAAGQVTPGPVFSTATFIGYLLGGLGGATLATVGIFLPAFFFVAISGPLVPRLRRSKMAGAFLDGVNVASLALMAVVTWHLGRVAIVDLPTLVLASAAAFVLLRFRVGSIWVVLGGAIAGAALGARGQAA